MEQATENVLRQLKGLHLPQAIHQWPTAPGWFFLLGILLLLTAGVIYILIQHYKHTRARQLALVALEEIACDVTTPKDRAAAVQRLSKLLKRVALAYYPRSDVASLYGDKWLMFLDAQAKGKTTFVRDGQLLSQAAYQKEVAEDIRHLFELAKIWIKER